MAQALCMNGRGKEGRPGTHGDHERYASFSDHDQPGFCQAVSGAQYRRVHIKSDRRLDTRYMGYARPLPYVGKVMHMVFNMDRMVGKDFETGLANLKAIAEKLDR